MYIYKSKGKRKIYICLHLLTLIRVVADIANFAIQSSSPLSPKSLSPVSLPRSPHYAAFSTGPLPLCDARLAVRCPASCHVGQLTFTATNNPQLQYFFRMPSYAFIRTTTAVGICLQG